MSAADFYAETVQLLRDASANHRATMRAAPNLTEIASEPGVTVERAEEAAEEFGGFAETAGGIALAAISALYRLAFAYGEDAAWRAVTETDARWLGWVLLNMSVQALPEPERGELRAQAVHDLMHRGED